MCKVFAYQNPSMHFDSLYTSLHFVQQCLAPQQYVSCWLRFIALQTFLSSEKAPVGQIRCGPVGRQTAAQESCSNHFGMLLSVGLVVAVAAVLFQAFYRFKSLKRCAKYLHIKTPQCILTVFTHLYTLFSNA